MIKVILLGSGNVAYHLARALSSAKHIDLVQRYSRDSKNDMLFDPNIPLTTNLDELQIADVYIIAINDDAIEAFTKNLSQLKGLVVHTSGSIPMMAISKNLRKGVLYPIQSFSKERPLNLRLVPFALETESNEDYKLLKDLATSISDHIFQVNSNQRKNLHVSAVFANNFSNYMYLTAKDICDQNQLPFEILKPIIIETAQKIMTMDPFIAQTGPAKRNDKKVIEKHLSSLKNEKKEIYAVLSEAINKRFQQ